MVEAEGPVATLPSPFQITSLAKSRSIAYMIAWRIFLFAVGPERLLSHSHDSGLKNSQPAPVTQTSFSLLRRGTSKFSTEPPGSTSTLPVSNATERAAASGMTCQLISLRYGLPL